MFDSIGRNGRRINRQVEGSEQRYRNFKIIEGVGGAGEATRVEKFVSPNKLARATEQGDRGGYTRGRGDMADLANAGEGLMTPLPQSGTAPRMLSAGGLMSAAYPLMQGDWKTAATIAASATAPVAASKLLTAKPVRTSLIRQATDPLPMLNPMTAALLMRQAENDKKRRGGP
jgi:hypothetical protein